MPKTARPLVMTTVMLKWQEFNRKYRSHTCSGCPHPVYQHFHHPIHHYGAKPLPRYFRCHQCECKRDDKHPDPIQLMYEWQMSR